MSQRYGVWCTRPAHSQLGFAEAWLKKQGQVETFTTEAEADRRCAEVQALMKSNIYTVRPYNG